MRSVKIDPEKLSLLRIDRGISQADLARRSGVSVGTIEGLSHGKSCFLRTASRIAEALKVPLSALLLGAPEMSPTTADKKPETKLTRCTITFDGGIPQDILFEQLSQILRHLGINDKVRSVSVERG